MLAGHPQLPKAQSTYDGVEQEQATALVTECRRHLLAALLHLLEHSLNDVGRPNVLPVQLRKGVKGQARLPIALQTRNRRWIDRPILFGKRGGEQVGLRPGS